MKFLLFLTLLIIPQSVFALTIDDSLLGLTSTKIRVLLGEPIEKVEYQVLNKSSFLYPDHILYFKDDILTKISLRNENLQPKKVVEEPVKNKKNDENPNLVTEMFSE